MGAPYFDVLVLHRVQLTDHLRAEKFNDTFYGYDMVCDGFGRGGFDNDHDFGDACGIFVYPDYLEQYVTPHETVTVLEHHARAHRRPYFLRCVC